MRHHRFAILKTYIEDWHMYAEQSRQQCGSEKIRKQIAMIRTAQTHEAEYIARDKCIRR